MSWLKNVFPPKIKKIVGSAKKKVSPMVFGINVYLVKLHYTIVI